MLHALHNLRAARVNDLRKWVDQQLGKALLRIDHKIAHQSCQSLTREKCIVCEASHVGIELLVRQCRELALLNCVVCESERRCGSAGHKRYLVAQACRLRDELGMMR